MHYALNIVSKYRFSLYLNIPGLRKGPGKFFTGVLDKSWKMSHKFDLTENWRLANCYEYEFTEQRYSARFPNVDNPKYTFCTEFNSEYRLEIYYDDVKFFCVGLIDFDVVPVQVIAWRTRRPIKPHSLTH